MLEFVTLEEAEVLDSFVMSHPCCHYMQTSYWGRVNPELPWRGILSRDAGGKIRGSVALSSYPVRGTKFHMLYAPRGPVLDWDDAETFQELLEGIQQLGRKTKGCFFRMDPAICAENNAVRQMLAEYGASITAIDDFSALQARLVYQLHLDGRSKAEILSGFAQKTRYNVRLAGKKGLRTEICGVEALPDFCAMMQATAARDHFVPRSQDYFTRFLRAMGPYARLYMAYLDEIAVSGAIAVQMGKKTWYAYGCSAAAYRNLMGSYLNQWEIISWAVDAGCTLYDLRGVEGYPEPGNPKLGLHRFKQGFGAVFQELIGQADLPLRRDWTLLQKTQKQYRQFISCCKRQRRL